MSADRLQQVEDSLKHRYDGYVGVFDSGVGGISVLKELVKEVPDENYLFFGDSLHAPYGEKTPGEIRKLTMKGIDRLAEAGVKAIVIACNTATSAAAAEVRQKYQPHLPVIGIEPAIKPAAEACPHGKILVMATPATLKRENYARLSGRLAGEAEFIPVMCCGLAGRIEKGNLDAPDLTDMLEGFIGKYRGKVDAVVLGCTHYPFIKNQIRRVLGDVRFFDGGAGTARQFHHCLAARGLLRAQQLTAAGKNAQENPRTEKTGTPPVPPAGDTGHVVFRSSLATPEEERLYERMYHATI